MDLNERSRILINNIDQLKQFQVVVIGLGGVGGIAAEALARCNIGHIKIIDHDIFNYSNLNRQILATIADIGQAKTAVAKKRLESVSQAKITAIKEKINSDNVYLLDQADYVIDAIDDVEAKIAIIKYCHHHNIALVSSLGMGNQINQDNIILTTLDQTKNDRLAKKMRKKLRPIIDISQVAVVACQKEAPIKSTPVGSLIFAPASAGLLLAQTVINHLLLKIK